MCIRDRHRGVQAICELAGVNAGEVHALVGPSICGRHYEVGEEVVSAFEQAGIPRAACVVAGRGARAHVDGRCAVSWQLASAGVEVVHHMDFCTWEEPWLWSWRRQGPAAGRLAAVVAIPQISPVER